MYAQQTLLSYTKILLSYNTKIHFAILKYTLNIYLNLH